MFEESRENTGGVIAGMLRSLEDGHLDIVPSAELEKAEPAVSPANSSSDAVSYTHLVDRFLQYIQQGGKKRRSALKYEMSVSHQGECLTELFVSILLRLDLSQGFAEGFPG